MNYRNRHPITVHSRIASNSQKKALLPSYPVVLSLRHLAHPRRLILLLLISFLLQPAPPMVQAQIGATRGTVIVAIAASSPPFSAQADNGQIVGFDLDLMKTVARTAGLRVSYEAVPFAQLIPGVATRLYDAALGCIFITDARKALVNFGSSYFTTGTVLVFAENNTPLYDVTDLTPDLTVSASAGSTAEAFLRDQSEAQVLVAASQQEALEMAAAGVADAALVDEIAASRFMRMRPEARLRIVSGLVTTDQCAIAVNKENPRLLLELNAALTRLKNNGKYLTMYRRWFGSRPLTGPRPGKRPTSETSAAGTIPTAEQTSTDQNSILIDGVIGAYAVTLMTDPRTYQLVELTEDRLWLESLAQPDAEANRGIQSLAGGQLPIVTGSWQSVRTDPIAMSVQISATVLFSATLANSTANGANDNSTANGANDNSTANGVSHSSASLDATLPIQLRKEYQLTIQDDGTLHGVYTLYTSAVPTVTQILTETVELAGQRLVQ